jgi:hypothetical protein
MEILYVHMEKMKMARISECRIGQLRSDFHLLDNPNEVSFWSSDQQIWAGSDGSPAQEGMSDLISFHLLREEGMDSLSISCQTPCGNSMYKHWQDEAEDEEKIQLWIDEQLQAAGVTSEHFGEDVWSDIRVVVGSSDEPWDETDFDFDAETYCEPGSDHLDVSTAPSSASGKLVVECRSASFESVNMTDAGIEGMDDGISEGDDYCMWILLLGSTL